ncbi:hypothetical protein Q9L58_010024 [Maublancomyces gigas]|uniref:F-box domain-containing protein n=1 Tax=Discina gigas TaxID=1032678 RepID=A0ABR3G5R3_9PEZI
MFVFRPSTRAKDLSSSLARLTLHTKLQPIPVAIHPQKLMPDILWLEVSRHLAIRDKKALSSTHSYLRGLISRILFNPPNRPIQVRKVCWNCVLFTHHELENCQSTEIFATFTPATLGLIRSMYLNGTEDDHSRVFGSPHFKNLKSVIFIEPLSPGQTELFLRFVKQLDTITVDIPITDLLEIDPNPSFFPIRSLNHLHRFQMDGSYLSDLPVAFGLGCSLTIMSFLSKTDIEVGQTYLTNCLSLLTYFSSSHFFPSLRVVGFSIPRPFPLGFPSPLAKKLEVRSKLLFESWDASLAHAKSGGNGWRLRSEEPTSIRRLLGWDSFWGCWCGQSSYYNIVLTSDEVNEFEKRWSKDVGVTGRPLHARAALTNFLDGRIHIDTTISTKPHEGAPIHGMIVRSDFAGFHPTVRCLTILPAQHDGPADLAWQFPAVTTLRLTENLPIVPQILVDFTALTTLHIMASQLGPSALDHCGHLKSYEFAFLRDCIALKELNVRGFRGCDQCDWRSLVMGLNRWLPIWITDVGVRGRLEFGETERDPDQPAKEWDMAWEAYARTVDTVFIDLIGRLWTGCIGVGGLWVKPRSYHGS